MGLQRVLIVDDTAASREGLEAALTSHCAQVVTAESCAQARDALAKMDDVSLVLVEAKLPGEDGFSLLAHVAHVAGLAGTPPPVIMVAARPDEAEQKRAAELGALGYLAKPVTFPDISRILRASTGTVQKAAPRVRSRPLGTAFLVDPRAEGDSRREQAPAAVWDIQDLSITGAFLETKRPLPLGRTVSLSLVLDGNMARVEAKVARVQKPCWEHAAGCGVSFTSFGEGSEEIVREFIRVTPLRR